MPSGWSIQAAGNSERGTETMVSGRRTDAHRHVEAQSSPCARYMGVYLITAAVVLVFAAIVGMPVLGMAVVGVLAVILGLLRRGRATIPFVLLAGLVLFGRVASTTTVGGTIPAALLFLGLVAFLYRHEMASELRRSAPARRMGLLAAIWSVWALMRLILDWSAYGQLAARDALIAVMFLAFLPGMAVARAHGRVAVAGAIRVVALCSCAVALIYPMRDLLPDAIYEVVDFSNIGIIGTALLAVSLWSSERLSLRVLCGISGIVAVFVSQGRMIFLVVICMVVVYLGEGIGRGLKDGGRLILTRAGVIVAAIMLMGITIFVISLVPGIEGRVASPSTSAVLQQLQTLSDSDSGSVADRQQWWASIWSRYVSSTDTIWAGLGLGLDLLDGYRAPDGSLVRKPHNDYLETLVRFGVLGGIAIFGILAGAIKPILRSVRSHSGEYAALGWWCLAAIATAFSQPYFAYPHGAIVFSFSVGILLVFFERMADE